MKKYITINHPDLKDGITLIDRGDILVDKDRNFGIYNIFECVEKGYIKELQEPIWTDQDMIEFAKYALGTFDTFPDQLEEFKKEKNK